MPGEGKTTVACNVALSMSQLEKTLIFEGYQQYLGKFWRPDLMRMINKQTGKETALVWTEYRFDAGLTENDFDAQRLPQMAR